MAGGVALSVVDASARDIACGWKWRERTGARVSPSDMETRHLFYTLRMIWNNRMPEHMRVGAVRLYDFGPHYTRDYFAQAILAIGRELRSRTDMKPEWARQYQRMQQWLIDRPFALVPPATPEVP